MTPTSSSLLRAAAASRLVLGSLPSLAVVLAACGTADKAATTTGHVAHHDERSDTGSAIHRQRFLVDGEQDRGPVLVAPGSGDGERSKRSTPWSTPGRPRRCTVEQAPRSRPSPPTGATVIDTGTTTYYCSDSGQERVPVGQGRTNPLASLTALFSPQTALTELKAVQAEAAAALPPVTASLSSSGSYAGQSTTCANVSGNGTRSSTA